MNEKDDISPMGYCRNIMNIKYYSNHERGKIESALESKPRSADVDLCGFLQNGPRFHPSHAKRPKLVTRRRFGRHLPHGLLG